MKRYSVFLIAMLLAGCASAPPQGATAPVLPGEQPQASVPSIAPEGAQTEEEHPVMSLNRAVVALLDRSRVDAAAGRREAAGASLERALRIEPRNAWLWNELAQVRLAQGQYAQAAALAKKSISFSGGDRRLQAVNWRVIGEARVALGDSAGAEQAFRTADELRQPEMAPLF